MRPLSERALQMRFILAQDCMQREPGAYARRSTVTGTLGCRAWRRRRTSASSASPSWARTSSSTWRARLPRRRLQPHDVRRRRLPRRPGRGEEGRRRPLARGARRRPRAAAQGHADGQGGQGRSTTSSSSSCRTSSRATSSSTAATRTSRTRSAARKYARGKGLLYIGTGVSGGEEGALHGPVDHARRLAGGLAARQADLPGDRGEGRGRRRPAATGSAPTAPATSSRWSTTASSTATCSSSARPTTLMTHGLGHDAPTRCTTSSPSGTRASSTAT